MDANRRRTLVAGAAATAAALLGVPGCGHTVTSSGAMATRAPAGASAAPGVKPTLVSVAMNEYSFSLPWGDLTAGTYTFLLTNEGTAPHAMAVGGPGITGVKQSETIKPGERTSLTVTLRPGRYEVWCPVDKDRNLGMDTAVIVR
ncbi:hypothetical protein [Nonomuraea sp. NPDC050691]|uniref:hypothetical protein n=1 Tax=Nonomuraea sp. NPDC050691 TaxID=3155661 RepID=UPI0033F56ABD